LRTAFALITPFPAFRSLMTVTSRSRSRRRLRLLAGTRGSEDMWGRYDRDERSGEWAAFTTDPRNRAFAWLVRHHPEHGRSVTLHHSRNEAAAYHQEWFDDRRLLTRMGGYWWDGQTWYRPRQVLSYVDESYIRRPVQNASTITAVDVLDASCDASVGQVANILQFEPGTVIAQRWRHDLALWAQFRESRTGVADLHQCVVSLTAPELAEGSLLGVEEFAQEAGIAASTLRAYLARGEADLPTPQSVDGGRKRWARPVVQDWVESRRRDPSNLAAVLTGDNESAIAPGLRRLWKRITKSLFRELWADPASRRRWSRPHRTEEAVHEVADQAGWIAALHLDSTVPFDDMYWIIRYAVMWELAEGKDGLSDDWIDLPREIGRILGWFIEHQPSRSPMLFGSVVRAAKVQLDIPQEVTEETLTRAVMLDSGIEDKDRLKKFLAVAFPPET
jgi:predicted DNA-binding transcriptional regulator AlpA